MQVSQESLCKKACADRIQGERRDTLRWGWQDSLVGKGACSLAGNFSLILGTHTVEGEKVLPEVVLKLATHVIKEKGRGREEGRQIGEYKGRRKGGKQNNKSRDTLGEKPECSGHRGGDISEDT